MSLLSWSEWAFPSRFVKGGRKTTENPPARILSTHSQGLERFVFILGVCWYLTPDLARRRQDSCLQGRLQTDGAPDWLGRSLSCRLGTLLEVCTVWAVIISWAEGWCRVRMHAKDCTGFYFLSVFLLWTNISLSVTEGTFILKQSHAGRMGAGSKPCTCSSQVLCQTRATAPTLTSVCRESRTCWGGNKKARWCLPGDAAALHLTGPSGEGSSRWLCEALTNVPW